MSDWGESSRNTVAASILVVDDDKEIRKMLTEILEGEGFSVETAENGEKAIRMAKKTGV